MSEDNNNSKEEIKNAKESAAEEEISKSLSELKLKELIAEPITLQELLIHVRATKIKLETEMAVLESIIHDKLSVPSTPSQHTGQFGLQPNDAIVPPLFKQNLILKHSEMKKVVFKKSEKEKSNCWDFEATIAEPAKRISPQVNLKDLSYTFEFATPIKEIAFFIRFIPNIDQQTQKKATVIIHGEIFDGTSTTSVNEFSFEQAVVPASTYQKQKSKANTNSPSN